MTAPVPTPKKRSCLRTLLLGTVGGVLVLCVLGALINAFGGGVKPTTPEPVNAVAAALPTEAAATPVPSTTPAPTATEGPTNTPRPTWTQTPPTATPEPQVFTGTGRKVLDVTFDVLTTLHLTHTGRRNFAVTASPDSGSPDLLVNTIGNYDGVRLLTPGHYLIEVEADGAWTATAAPLGRDDSAAGPMSGAGDDIRGAFQAPAQRSVYRFTHTGKRNFAVFLDCTTGRRDLLVNDIGPYDGEAVVTFGSDAVCVWDITADGKWTIAPK